MYQPCAIRDMTVIELHQHGKISASADSRVSFQMIPARFDYTIDDFQIKREVPEPNHAVNDAMTAI